MKLHPLGILLALVGGAASQYLVSVDKVCFENRASCDLSRYTNVTSFTDPISVSIPQPAAFELSNSMYWYHGNGNAFRSEFVLQAQQTKAYEDNNCDNTAYIEGVYSKALNQIPPVAKCYYVENVDASMFWARCKLGPSTEFKDGGFYEYSTVNDYWQDGVWKSKCVDYRASGEPPNYPNVYVLFKFGDSRDKCTYTSDKACNTCSWPYASKRDSTGCGCKVDRSKYQSAEKLRTAVAVYCNTYSDGTGRQYYLDDSRSNFNSANGEVYGACSAVPNSTVYMPVGTCPLGTHIDTLTDTTAQPAVSKVPKPTVTGGTGTGTGNDTATHNRLDSILGQLSRDAFTDSLLNAAYDSATAGTTGLTATTDSISRIGSRIASNYGDTTGNQLGLTDSAAFDIRLRNPWDTTNTFRTSEQTGTFFGWVLTVWKTARSIVLAIWGLVCWWIMLTIAGTI